MATIYADQHELLKTLLAKAGKNEDATILIPDLQRPYVWQPAQVVVLVDSLIRGWPFGTLLTWKVTSDDPARGLARAFWRVVDRVGEESGQPISMKNPPAAFQMILDGQQRVQSLLLALGGDGWGFRLLDRQWHELLNGVRPRGPRGKAHWSLGCLCVDAPTLAAEYAQHKRAASIDYSKVLQWVVTDNANGQSNLAKPASYIEPLPRADERPGEFIRLARLWEAAPDQSIDNYEAEDIAACVFAEHGTDKERVSEYKRSLGALIIALREVKHTRVTYLELSEYTSTYGTRDIYNDAIVNIFTRLNTAGRTLTREDITFAWLKIGWNTASTENKSAKACIDALVQTLEEAGVPLTVEDVISSISFVWSASFNAGKLLTNNDLMRGEAIRPMADEVSRNWSSLVEAATHITEHAKDRGLVFREHYQSVSALSHLWAWYFIALRWSAGRALKVVEKDAYEKKLGETLDLFMDRWLICTQWAGIWSTANAASVSKYAASLFGCTQALNAANDIDAAIKVLAEQLEASIKDVEQGAVSYLSTMTADDRQQVRGYYTALWIWNRLDEARWKCAKIALREKSRRKNFVEVDHIVAFDLWKKKLSGIAEAAKPENESGQSDLATLESKVNEIGNCMLLEKNFNISKSNAQLSTFLSSVLEFKENKLTIDAWSAALGLDAAHVACNGTNIDILQKLFSDRSQRIRDDLEKFVRGTVKRVDLLIN